MKLVHAPFYQNYVATVQGDFLQVLEEQLKKIEQLVVKLSLEELDFSYAEGKWTVAQLLMHCMDTEQIMGYRALAVSRGDKNPLPGFNENDYARESLNSTPSKENIASRFIHLRKSTISLFSSMNDTLLSREGSADGMPINVLSLGFIIAGHWNHHLSVLTNRYSIIS